MATRAEQFRAETQRSGPKKAPASSKGTRKPETTEAEGVTALGDEGEEKTSASPPKSKRDAADLGKRAVRDAGSPVVRAAQAKAKSKKTR